MLILFTNLVVAVDAVPDGGARLAAGQRVGEVERGLADRARRIHQGLRQRGRQPVDRGLHAGAHHRGGAHTTDLLDLAREVRDGVEGRFGIRLVNEPVLVGCEI